MKTETLDINEQELNFANMNQFFAYKTQVDKF